MRTRDDTPQKTTSTRGRLRRTDDDGGTAVERRRAGGRLVPSLTDGPRSFGGRACRAPPREGVFWPCHSSAASIAPVARPRPLLNTPTGDALGGAVAGIVLTVRILNEKKCAQKRVTNARAAVSVWADSIYVRRDDIAPLFFFSGHEKTV